METFENRLKEEQSKIDEDLRDLDRTRFFAIKDVCKEYEGKVNIYKVNTEQEQELAGAFGIKSIPSMLFVPMDGKPQMSVGALPKDGLIQAMDEVLNVKN